MERWALRITYTAIVCAFLYPLVHILGEPYLLNYTEGILLHAAMQVLGGDSLYGDMAAPPHAYFAYGPLHSLIAAALLAISGPSILPLRLLALICELLIVLLVYRALRARRLEARDAVAGAMLAMGVLGLHKFHAIARVDMLLVAAEIWALSELLCFLEHRRTRHLICLAAAMALALLTKSSAAIMLGGLGLIALLVLRKDRRQGAALLAALTAAALVYGLIALAWNAASGGAFFRFQSSYQAASGFCDPRREDCFWVFFLFRVVLLHYGSFLALGLASAVLLRGGGHLGLLTLISLVWMSLASFKRGADLNYTIEPLVLLCLLVGLSLPRWRALASRRIAARSRPVAADPSSSPSLPAQLVVPALLLLALASRAAAGYAIHDWMVRSMGHPSAERTATLVTLMRGDPDTVDLERPFDLMAEQFREDRRMLAALSRQADGVLLAEEPLFAVLAGKPVWVTDPFQTWILAGHGLFDPAPVVEACRSGQIRWVFAGWRLLMLEGMEEVLNSHFRPVYRTRSPIGSSFWTVYERR